MKKILFIVIVLISFKASAQMQTEGSVRYLITHSWTKKIASLSYFSKQQKEKISYMWSGRDEWKMYCNLYFNQKESKYVESEEKAEKEDEGGYSWRKDVYIVKRNFENQTMSDAIETLGKTYIIEDTLAGMDWKIQNDLKEVAGHVCMKAVTEDTIKKQKIVAWFAQDIPLSTGPERFYGLPGMILEVDINDGGMIVTADRIDLMKLTNELDLPKKLKGKKVKDADYQKVLKNHIDSKIKEEQPYWWGLRY